MTVPQLYVICLLSLTGAAFCAWQVRRALRNGANEVEQIIADARARTVPLLGTGPGPDERPGSDAELQDQLELIWSLPAHGPDLDALCDRLRNAIRQQREEDQK
ncbi:hypothetical protein ACH40E_03100 [Streptomyces acidicola]|uniref:hypothetical protein n=1 Tax=Streptomyces acidicola TaxID=2596892 RepID=UPI0037A25B22